MRATLGPWVIISSASSFGPFGRGGGGGGGRKPSKGLLGTDSSSFVLIFGRGGGGGGGGALTLIFFDDLVVEGFLGLEGWGGGGGGNKPFGRLGAGRLMVGNLLDDTGISLSLVLSVALTANRGELVWVVVRSRSLPKSMIIGPLEITLRVGLFRDSTEIKT